MKRTFTAIVLGAFIISLVFVSCKKNTDEEAPQNNQIANFYSTSLSGLGNHGGIPSGNAFVLPANIKIIGSLTGGNPGNKESIFQYSKTIENIPVLPKTDYTIFGVGTYVNVYMKLLNTSNQEYDLIIPEGTIMCDSIRGDSSGRDTCQSGIIIRRDTIRFGGGDTLGVCLKSFCLNQHFPAPYSQVKYYFAVVTNNDKLTQVIGILKNKKTLASHTGEIQGIIWHITDGEGLSQADIDLMNSWE